MICTTMIVSGLLTALTAVVHTPAQLYFARSLLGAAEAGFFPSVIVYLSHWFIQEDQYFIGYSVIFWLPTVLKSQSGFSDLQVGLFGAMPYVVALFAILFNGWHSYKGRERRWHAAAPLVIAATDHCASSVCPARM